MAQSRVLPENLDDQRFAIVGPEAHHAVRVLRMKPGDEIHLFDGRGRRARGVITTVDAAAPSVSGKVLEVGTVTTDRYRIRLVQGVPKGSKIDFVIEKAVELGVDEIVPFLGDRGQIRLDRDAAEAKAARWNRIAEAAAKQCDRPDVPPVRVPVRLADIAETLVRNSTFVCSLGGYAVTLKRGLRSDEGNILKPNSDIINVVVGPESGLSTDEEAALTRNGARLISLGGRVLRTETAGLAALSILQYELNQR